MSPMPLALIALAALGLSACQKPADEAFGARVRTYLLENPEVLEEVSVKLQEKKQLAAQDKAKEAIRRYRTQLERDPRDFVANPGGSITVVEFFDYNCGYCKLVAPEVVKLIRENPDVRFVFKEFAFQTGDSVEAAKIALTAPAKQKGLELHANLMAQKPLNQAAIDRSLQAAGIDVAAARQAARHPAIERQLMDVHALTSALGIEGTPAFVVGETIIPGADIDALRVAIANAKAKDLKRPT